jgi:transposase
MDYEQEIAKRDEIIRQQKAEIERLKAENERLKELLDGKAISKDAKKPTFTENYSLSNHESKKNKKRRKRRKKSTGRRPKSDKESQFQIEIDVYWDSADRKACILHTHQYAWRFIDGKAVYVRYNLYDLPDSKQLPTPPGLRNRRSEYGIEIIITLAFLHYWIGVSIDNARMIIKFFTGLELPKSQADSLLSQLADDWSDDYEAIAELIALQIIVYVDETGWKVGKRSCYTWAFCSALYVLFRCGVGRGKDQAQAILGEQFTGIGVSDDYAAYKDLFTEHQLCWAHFLRKAIKLALQNPDRPQYAEFLDRLYDIYCLAVRYQKDGRLSVGRAQKVGELCQAIVELCTQAGQPIEESTSDEEATLIRLQNELVENLECLFVFVEHPEVERTNNRTERQFHREAEVRKGGRTSKTDKGAKRRSIIMTVFASLRTRIEDFTMETVLEEILGWIAAGCSIFRRELDEIHRSGCQARASPA